TVAGTLNLWFTKFSNSADLRSRRGSSPTLANHTPCGTCPAQRSPALRSDKSMMKSTGPGGAAAVAVRHASLQRSSACNACTTRRSNVPAPPPLPRPPKRRILTIKRPASRSTSGKRNKLGIETVYRASHDVGTAKQGQLFRSLRDREHRPTGKATLLNHRKRQ